MSSVVITKYNVTATCSPYIPVSRMIVLSREISNYCSVEHRMPVRSGLADGESSHVAWTRVSISARPGPARTNYYIGL